jgi:hypothetical protein
MPLRSKSKAESFFKSPEAGKVRLRSRFKPKKTITFFGLKPLTLLLKRHMTPN